MTPRRAFVVSGVAVVAGIAVGFVGGWFRWLLIAADKLRVQIVDFSHGVSGIEQEHERGAGGFHARATQLRATRIGRLRDGDDAGIGRRVRRCGYRSVGSDAHDLDPSERLRETGPEAAVDGVRVGIRRHDEREEGRRDHRHRSLPRSAGRRRRACDVGPRDDDAGRGGPGGAGR